MSEILCDQVNGNKDTRSDFLLKEAILHFCGSEHDPSHFEPNV